MRRRSGALVDLDAEHADALVTHYRWLLGADSGHDETSCYECVEERDVAAALEAGERVPEWRQAWLQSRRNSRHRPVSLVRVASR